MMPNLRPPTSCPPFAAYYYNFHNRVVLYTRAPSGIDKASVSTTRSTPPRRENSSMMPHSPSQGNHKNVYEHPRAHPRIVKTRNHGEQPRRGTHFATVLAWRCPRTTGDTRHPTAATRSRRGATLPPFPLRLRVRQKRQQETTQICVNLWFIYFLCLVLPVARFVDKPVPLRL